MKVYKTDSGDQGGARVIEPEILINVEDLHGLLGRTDVRIVDCRFELTDPRAGAAAYRSGHIPGAVYADLDRDLAAPLAAGSGRHPLPDPGTLAETLGRLGIDRHTMVVVYDDASGAIAARAWWLLHWLGHDRACLLNGGFGAWQRAGFAVERGTVTVPRREFSPSPRPELVLDTEEIIRAGDRGAALRLVDARSAARFEGKEEPIDRVAGHIPGSVNLPFTDNVLEDGRWKAISDIRERLEQVLGRPDNGAWAVTCGSGVTACHLVVAGLLAGYEEPRVYVGSWSEWIADGDREIALGPEEEQGPGRNLAEDP